MSKTIILIVAAGRGLRAGGDIPKQYVKQRGRYVLSRTIDAFLEHPLVSHIQTVIHPDDMDLYQAATKDFDKKLLPPVHGGTSRQESVYNGLKALSECEADHVLIHDAARPFVSSSLITRVIEGLAQDNAVLPVTPVIDTIKQVDGNRVSRTIERKSLYGAQTPQGFSYPLILDLHKQADHETDVEFTDDASLAEWANIPVQTVEGDVQNQKLTTRRDMDMAELILANADETQMETRTGFGFDVHRFEPGDGVILCGIKIPFDKKLKGHSDADVAMHALTDALLGAVGEGDIGAHFPPSDPQWAGAASSLFLEHAVELIRKRSGKIINVDVTIICEQPKIGPHREKMRQELARIMGVEAHRISIKATTTERLGFTGRDEGMAAQAIASITLRTTPEPQDV